MSYHHDPGFDRAQRQWDAREPKDEDPRDCDTCGNTGEICKLHQEPFDDCPCAFPRGQCESDHLEPCPEECEWRDE